MRKHFKGLLTLLIVLTLALPLQAKEVVTILSVVDGDTMGIRYQGREENIRLIGIDAPESKPNEKAKRDAQRSGQDLKTIITMGKEATKLPLRRVAKKKRKYYGTEIRIERR